MNILSFSEYLAEGYKDNIKNVKMKKEYLKNIKNKTSDKDYTTKMDKFFETVSFTPPEFRKYLKDIGLSIMVSNVIGIIDDEDEGFGVVSENDFYGDNGIISNYANGKVSLLDTQKAIYDAIRPILAKIVKAKATSIEDIEKIPGITKYKMDY